VRSLRTRRELNVDSADVHTRQRAVVRADDVLENATVPRILDCPVSVVVGAQVSHAILNLGDDYTVTVPLGRGGPRTLALPIAGHTAAAGGDQNLLAAPKIHAGRLA
jgi:hypothetical protein